MTRECAFPGCLGDEAHHTCLGEYCNCEGRRDIPSCHPEPADDRDEWVKQARREAILYACSQVGDWPGAQLWLRSIVEKEDMADRAEKGES